jgi:putative membrane protein insertion efficiency factor
MGSGRVADQKHAGPLSNTAVAPLTRDRERLMVKVLIALIRLYRFAISPFLGQVCRFHPSCSRYAEDCLLTHGLFEGSWLALKRLGKCHPFHPGGLDPAPPKGYRHTHKSLGQHSP